MNKMVGLLTATILVTHVATVHADADAASVSAARDALELGYLNNRIFPVVDCRIAPVEGRSFINCRAAGSDAAGALWIVETGPQLFWVNGRALQHSRAMGGTVHDVTGKNIQIQDWRAKGVPVSIPNALQAFR